MNHEGVLIDSKQTQIAPYIVMEYIKSHTLSFTELESISKELTNYIKELNINLMSNEDKISIILYYTKEFFPIKITPEANKAFNDFLSKVSI